MLHVSGFSGTVVDNALNKQNQQKCTTFDVDKNYYQPGNCG